ncbi:MAG: AAA family ATPase [bacterium]|nr:AAA family ATPase [bacterium]MDZ4285183.1 AAA family ATPase [Patescibacteria group bacterium]
MPSVALYRKYRPTSFAEVAGQPQVTRALEGALKGGSIAHAYLFAGSRGTGKTSVARIFARAAGVGESDLYEIDAASNRGIDDVRALREQVHTLPFGSPYKCYIIDECHSLTKDAYNALLKTLEEPPPHALFILATTELEKVPETVVSRCELHRFRKPALRELGECALSVAEAEGYTLEPQAAELVALIGDGSFRDTLGALQKVLSAGGADALADKKIKRSLISADAAATILGAPSAALIRDFVGALAERNLPAALALVGTAAGQGGDLRLFAELLLRRLRFILLLRYAPDMADFIRGELSDEDFATARELARRSDTPINSATLAVFLAAAAEIPRAAIPELPLELALVDSLDPSNDKIVYAMVEGGTLHSKKRYRM